MQVVFCDRCGKRPGEMSLERLEVKGATRAPLFADLCFECRKELTDTFLTPAFDERAWTSHKRVVLSFEDYPEGVIDWR